MKFLKLKASLLALFTTLAASGFGSFNLQAKQVNAEITDKYFIMTLRGNKSYYGRPLAEGQAGSANQNQFISDCQSIGFTDFGNQVENYQTSTSYRDVVSYGKEVTGSDLYNLFKDSLDSDTPERYYSNEHNVYLSYDGIVYTQSNANIHITDKNSYARIGLSFDGNVVDYLNIISKKAECAVVIPCLYFDNVPVAYFSISYSENNDVYTANGNRKMAIYFDKNIIQRGVVFRSIDKYYDNDLDSSIRMGSYAGECFMLLDIAPDTISKISSIGQLTYDMYAGNSSDIEPWRIDSGSRYDFTKYMFSPEAESQQLRIRTYYNAYVAPAEIGSLKVAQGTIVLTHPLTREKYGVGQNHWFLKSITMKLYNQGNYINETYSIATASEYNNFENTGTIASGKIFWGTRFPYDSEYQSARTVDGDNVTFEAKIGEGGLIYGYQMCGGEMVRPSHSSIITVTSATFYLTDDEQDRFEFYSEINDPTEITITYNDEYRYEYYADPATTRIHADMYERNESSDHSVEVNGTVGAYVVTGILTGGVGPLVIWLASMGATEAISKGTNIQRFYFNFYDLFVNESIPLDSVTKLQFKYQLGNYPRETIRYKWIDDSDHSKGYKSIELKPVTGEGAPEIKFMTVEKQPGHDFSYNVASILNVTVEQQDVFVDGTENQTIINNIRYNYFFQHIYHVSYENGEVTEAPDWMCYYSPLSVWYETTAGDTIRGTTDKDGYYLAEDADGKTIVMNMDDPEHPSDMTVDEFLDRETDTTVVNYDDPAPNDTDKTAADVWSNIQNWFQNMGTFFKILAIIAIVIIVIILLVLIIRFIRWIYRSLKDDGGGHRRN